MSSHKPDSTPSPSTRYSRREVLGFGLTVAAGSAGGLLGLRPSQALALTPAEAKYVDVSPNERLCVGCLSFVPGATPEDPGTCPIVPGVPIQPKGTCRMWGMKRH